MPRTLDTSPSQDYGRLMNRQRWSQVFGGATAALLSFGAGGALAQQQQLPAVASYGMEAPQLAASGSIVAVAEVTGTSAQLLLGSGGIPQPVTGTGPLPAWAQPSLGTNASGRAVVVYPRCGDPADVASCDLYSYELAAKRERQLPGLNARGAGEVDGAMTRGAVAFNRWQGGTALPRRRLADETTRLMYRPVGGPTRLVTRRGGRQLALRGRWIAQVRNLVPFSAGECGRPAVELISLGGQRRIARAGICGEQGRVPSWPRFAGADLVWAESWGDEPGHVYRYGQRARRLFRARTSVAFSTLALSSADAGWAIQQRYLPLQLSPGSPPPSAPMPVAWVYDLVRVTGLPTP